VEDAALRITGGRFGGRILAAPADASVRPTADKVRQAIFNILEHRHFASSFTLAHARALDLFAGTGAMGLEAISRGASFCLFVDNSVESRALLRRNVESLQLTGITKIWRRDAANLGPMPASSGGPFDLVFIDPPYRKNLLAPALAGLRHGDWLSPNALVVTESSDNEAIDAPFPAIDRRVYGDTQVIFFLVSGS
jgi:16S rRNA (guanine966-N2)-methyltransferase